MVWRWVFGLGRDGKMGFDKIKKQNGRVVVRGPSRSQARLDYALCVADEFVDTS